ncbi:hypothetical protein GFS24_21200 [Chitinophaga sp. SYP-B3965]|uniref:ankyrin repeat domain-containing protein n=1 Tax=Chitinophaga sp. SYP-B3965 TaxID=2663120 RepID=UPI001299D217|nr:ankyrin repeat domain-containing protein [Chitinophaga sp. SYP-B3965]MRG47654.1 hypothetical protein [Chitinophaga sp. SYP-B3965]
MQNDPIIRQAVAAIDAGDIIILEALLAENPWLVTERLLNGEEGYFKDPYLLWYIAGNPVRQPKLADNIVAVASLIIKAMKTPEQVGYTLALVCSGRIPRESGKQLALIDLLVSAGANPGESYAPAAIHKEVEALEHLIKKSGKMTLLAAIGTGRLEEVKQLITAAGKEELQQGLALAAVYGNAEILTELIKAGADVNAFCPPGFHDHSMPLHQAVASRDLASVIVLVEAGADLHKKDSEYSGTPIGWAIHMEQFPEHAAEFAAISSWLRDYMSRDIAQDLFKAGLISAGQVEQAVPIISKKLGK